MAAISENQLTKKGGLGKPFTKGVSGNPSGRPKTVGEVVALARQHTELAVNTLVQIALNGEAESSRVSAAIAILDRGWGKAPQTIDMTSADGSMSPPQLLITMVPNVAVAAPNTSS